MSAVSGSRARWAILLAALAPMLAAAPAGADESSPAPPTAAAWFPSGVGTVTAAAHPEGTLHVGAAVGQETDRTYLHFELSSLPDDAEVEEVTVTVPVDPDAGTLAPEGAVILGCAVPGGFDPDAATPTEVDCDGAPEATFVAGDAPAFALSLSPPARGTTVDVALVPGGGDTWHVGFDGADGDAPPTAVASYDAPTSATTTTVASRPIANPPAPGGPITLPPVTVPSPAAPPPAAGDEPAAPATPAVAGVPAGAASGFRYAAVFGLPLALLVIVALMGDGLTRPVRLREDAT